MLQLNNLKSAGKDRKRIGRGGSRGGTSGRGHKGQKARTSGPVRLGFEGGQMPLIRRLPKRGFTNARFKKSFEVVGIDRLEKQFEGGDKVTRDSLIEKGIFKPSVRFFKILGNGTLTKSLDVQAHAFSQSALDAISGAGGKAIVIEER